MTAYNYIENVTADIVQVLKDVDNMEILARYSDNVKYASEELFDILLIDDSVTGNGSGTYTFNSLEAEQNLVGNWSLLEEALALFADDDINILEKGAEFCDVTIRCYVLREALENVLEKLSESLPGYEVSYEVSPAICKQYIKTILNNMSK